MQQKQLRIINKLGLHARAATKFANLANKHNCGIKVSFDGKTIDGKSIMSLMLLAAAKGSNIEVKTDGPDEKEALNALEELICNKFDEAE